MKNIFNSKTFWFNTITILIGVIQVVNKSYPIPPEILGLIMGFGNLILRTLTGEPVKFGNKTFYKDKHPYGIKQ